jgi:ubiquinone/menaquinone biosynthesis C-methylase UbiE
MASRIENRQDALRSVQFLEEQTHFPDQRAINNRLMEELHLEPGELWLEVGSGSGALGRKAASHLDPRGCVIGMDSNFNYIPQALTYARRQGIYDSICFLAGSAAEIPFPDDSFNGAFAARLLLNVEQPDAIILEMIRVVQPGRLVVVMDWDFETITVNHSQIELTRKILHWRADHYGSNSWSGRQLYGRMKKAGLKDIQIYPLVSLGFDNQSAMYDALNRAARAALNGGGVTEMEHQSWMTELEHTAARGDFFASINYYIVSGHK